MRFPPVSEERVPKGRKKVAGGGPSAARGTSGTCRQTIVRPGGAREGAAAPVTAPANQASPAPPGRSDWVWPESRWLRSCLAPPPANFLGPSGAAPKPLAKSEPTTPGPEESGRNLRYFSGKMESRVKGQRPVPYQHGASPQEPAEDNSEGPKARPIDSRFPFLKPRLCVLRARRFGIGDRAEFGCRHLTSA